MEIALNENNERIYAQEAEKNENYFCPSCGGKVVLRKGKINTPHFAHKDCECTDSWNYDMSEWHSRMQSRFPIEQREVVITHNGETHRADILCGKRVIEFQHSPISFDEICERNNFYTNAGYSIAWVFDLQSEWDSNAIDEYKRNVYRWKNPKRCLSAFDKPNAYSKNIVLYSYMMDAGGYESFDRFIWSSTNDYEDPDFKKVVFAKYSPIDSDGDLYSRLNVDDFFITQDDMLKQDIAAIKHKYEIKVSGIKGNPQKDYICPKTKKFGIPRYGDDACMYCAFCSVIKNQPGGFESYCCYPNAVRELDPLGYPIDSVPIY